MRTLSNILVLSFLLTALAACSGPGNVPQPPAEPEVNVLMVTATHGFRHGPAIDAAKVVMTQMSAETILNVDITEDIDDLNTENLANYDVLFFANSTLRAADDFPSDAMPANPMQGTWGIFDLTVLVPDGSRPKATLSLSGTPSSLSGAIQTDDGGDPVMLDAAALNGDQLTFSFTLPGAGEFTAETTLDGDELKGSVSAAMGTMELEGMRVGPNEDATAGQEPEEARVTAAHRAAIMDFVSSGKGVAVAHAGLDAFYKWDEYREMVGGGLFDSHPWTQEVGITIEEQGSPAAAHFGDSFMINDEIYVLDNNPRWNSRVMASLDMSSVGVLEGPADGSQNDFPIAWVRKHNGGKVFVTKLGHFPHVWNDPGFQQHIKMGLLMVAGKEDAKFGGYRVKEVIAADVWPDDIAVDERGNVWIAELRGKIHRYDAETKETTLLVEMETTDPTGIEHGIYGIEVDPNFYGGEPYVYIFYAEPHTFINTLSRFEWKDGMLDMSSEHVILRVPTEPQCCHQAGDLEWGPDGTLYVSTGDTGYSGTKPEWEVPEERLEAFKVKHELTDYHWTRLVDSEYTSQNMTDSRGKILRINKDGTIPKDNPFYGEPGVRWDIYAYGLRNPYRFKVDHDTGILYIGVVGPDGPYDYDEYNISENGGENFGWPRSIGKLFYNEWTPDMIPNFVPPIWEYNYEQGGRSATVGPIYRHTGENAFPEFMQNKIFVYDWSRRWIKYADVADATFTTDTDKDYRTPALDLALPAKRLVNIKQFDQLTRTTPISMELGPDGSIYLAEYDGFWDPGPNAQVSRYYWVDDE